MHDTRTGRQTPGLQYMDDTIVVRGSGTIINEVVKFRVIGDRVMASFYYTGIMTKSPDNDKATELVTVPVTVKTGMAFNAHFSDATARDIPDLIPVPLGWTNDYRSLICGKTTIRLEEDVTFEFIGADEKVVATFSVKNKNGGSSKYEKKPVRLFDHHKDLKRADLGKRTLNKSKLTWTPLNSETFVQAFCEPPKSIAVPVGFPASSAPPSASRPNTPPIEGPRSVTPRIGSAPASGLHHASTDRYGPREASPKPALRKGVRKALDAKQ